MLIIRMVRSVVMTRLLFPEVYGLMTIVWAVLTGLQMFADTGISATIIRDKKGDDPDFLNTAFTTNVLRGALLWLASCVLAIPIATIYQQPALERLLPATGLTALVHGFVSTSLYTRRRHMDFKRPALLDLSNEVVLSVVLVIWAYISPTVWSLVGGAILGQIFLVVASRFYLPGIRNTFRWDRSALDAFFSFGKWIYLSSIVYFLSTQSDRFLLGKYLALAQLGVYGTATVLSGAVQAVVLKINSDVLYPAFSKVALQGRDRMKHAMLRTRLVGDLIMVMPISALIVLGGRVVDLLYDPRYHEAGSMLQILAIRLALVATESNGESCLTALGHPKYSLGENLARTIAIVVGIPTGWWLAGVRGVIWAVAIAEIPPLLVIWAGLLRQGMFSAMAEMRSLLFVGAGLALGMGLLRCFS